MTKVYLIVRHEFDGGYSSDIEIYAVYKTREAAELKAAALNYDADRWTTYEVEEHDARE